MGLENKTLDKSLLQNIEDFFVEIESYHSPYAEAIGDTGEIIFPLIRKTSFKAAALSAGMGILPGKISLIGLIPEVFFLLRLQSKMVKDIAVLLGKEKYLTRHVLMYCLFKENKPDIAQSLLRMTATKMIAKPLALESIYSLFNLILKAKSETLVRKKGRYLFSIVSSLAGGSLSYMDTQLVGITANSLFLSEVQLDPLPGNTNPPLENT